MTKGLRIKAFLSILFFCAVSMGIMFVFMEHKAITIANVAQDQVEDTQGKKAESGAKEEGMEQMLRFRPGEENTDYFCIPLESGVRAEDISMENHYMDRQVWIYIKNTSKDYYGQEAVFGNISQIEAGSYEVSEEAVLLKFSLDNVYECRSIMEESHLYIEFVPPREMYEKIIVLDAGCGGEDRGVETSELIEKDVTLDLVKRLKILLEETDIKVYYTRMEDVYLSQQERVELANAVRADMLISLRLNESEDRTVYGTEALYNENYFIPGFGSVDLADLVERNVVTGISGKGNGLYAAGSSDILLQEAKIPATVIKVGYVSNVQEAMLLQRDDYRDRIAKGLFEAILEAYE